MSATGSNGNGAARPGRRLRIILFVSLALNLLVVGLVVGAMASHRFGADGRAVRYDHAGGPMARALGEEDRRALARKMRESWRERRPDYSEIRAEFERVIAALEAVPYDPAVVRASVERQMDAMAEGARMGRELLLERLEGMSDAERAAYAGRLREELERKRKPRKERDGRRGGVHDHR